MRLLAIGALLVARLASESDAQSTSNASSRASAETLAVTGCEQLGLVSLAVRGAPNVFCVSANTCNTNYVGSCPGANAVDVKGVSLVSGSCCAALENTGDVGCVSRELISSGQFQCLAHAGVSDSAPVVDITTATPPPSTAAPTTTTPPPTTKTTTPKTTSPASDGSNSGDTIAPATTTPASTPEPTSDKPSSKPLPDSPNVPSSSGSASQPREPDAGDEPTTKAPLPTRTLPATPFPPAAVIASLPPITESPQPTHSSKAPDSENKNPVSAAGNSSTASSGGLFTSSLNGNVVLFIVLGAVGSVAVVLGALIFRRKTSSTPSETSSISGKTFDHDMPPLTLDNDEDFLEDLQFRQTDAFSPIFVQPTHSYSESTSPGHDRQSYFL